MLQIWHKIHFPVAFCHCQLMWNWASVNTKCLRPRIHSWASDGTRWNETMGEGSVEVEFSRKYCVNLSCYQHVWTQHKIKCFMRMKLFSYTCRQSSPHLFSALSPRITSNVTGRVFPPHCWELLPGFWTNQLPGNKPISCNTGGILLQRDKRARA